MSRISLLLFRDGFLFPFDLAREYAGRVVAGAGAALLEFDRSEPFASGYAILDAGRAVQVAARAATDDRWREIDCNQPEAYVNYKHLPHRNHKGLISADLRKTHPGSRLTDGQMGIVVAGIVTAFHTAVGVGAMAYVLVREPQSVPAPMSVVASVPASVEGPKPVK